MDDQRARPDGIRADHDASGELNRDAARQATLARIAARRERQRGRPIAVRIVAAGAGALLGLGGLALLLWLPELGIPLLLAGLSLLALEFVWASRAVIRVEWWSLVLRRWLARRSPATKIMLTVAAVAVAIVVLWLSL